MGLQSAALKTILNASAFFILIGCAIALFVSPVPTTPPSNVLSHVGRGAMIGYGAVLCCLAVIPLLNIYHFVSQHKSMERDLERDALVRQATESDRPSTISESTKHFSGEVPLDLKSAFKPSDVSEESESVVSKAKTVSSDNALEEPMPKKEPESGSEFQPPPPESINFARLAPVYLPSILKSGDEEVLEYKQHESIVVHADKLPDRIDPTSFDGVGTLQLPQSNRGSRHEEATTETVDSDKVEQIEGVVQYPSSEEDPTTFLKNHPLRRRGLLHLDP